MENDRHVGGTALFCDLCGNEIFGVWHTPELISENGKMCYSCFKATKKQNVASVPPLVTGKMGAAFCV